MYQNEERLVVDISDALILYFSDTYWYTIMEILYLMHCVDLSDI